MNTYFLLAAGISAVSGVLRSILGERLIFSKLAAAGLPETLGSPAFILRVLRLFWHLVSVAWWGFTALLVLLASMPVTGENQRLIRAIALTFLASAVVSFIVSRGKHFSWGLRLGEIYAESEGHVLFPTSIGKEVELDRPGLTDKQELQGASADRFHWFVLLLAATSSLVTLTACQNGPTSLTAEVPLHLEDHLDAAIITGSETPSEVPDMVEWCFEVPQPDWKPITPPPPKVKPAQVERTKDGLRITLTRANRSPRGLFGGIYIELPDWRREEWADVLVRARTSERVDALAVGFAVGFNPRSFRRGRVPVIRDGTQQTYALPVGSSSKLWQQLGIAVWAQEPASIDILSVSLVPKEARFASAPLGVKTETRGRYYRRALYTHAPSKLEYRVRMPEAGRLDVGLGVVRDEVPVTFRITARSDGEAVKQLLDESYSDNGRVPPDQVPMIQEHLHRAGYQTALLTSNPNAGTMSGLDRGVDLLRERGVEEESRSSEELHTDFWNWRREYPGKPYWVHFQTTDVHAEHNPPEPFAGLYVSPERRAMLDQWTRKLGLTNYWPSFSDLESGVFEKAGIGRVAFYNARRDLSAECLAHQDYQIGLLVDRLKARGEWENTLLVIASDHGADAGSIDFSWFTRETLAPRWQFFSTFRPGMNRIPMVFVWPGHIPPGQRFRDPVSMIDMLPTILDLVGLPEPEVKHGQSLAPLLRGEPGWQPRPVILDEFRQDVHTGELRGQIEVVDGRWAASLQINPDPDRPREVQRPVPLLLYDLWNDPYCLKSLHEERPDLVRKYTELLETQFEAHQVLAQRFTRGEDSPLTPEQLRTLRSLGYIQ